MNKLITIFLLIIIMCLSLQNFSLNMELQYMEDNPVRIEKDGSGVVEVPAGFFSLNDWRNEENK